MRSAAPGVMPRSAGPDWSWRTAGSLLPPAGTSAKSWETVFGFRAGLPESPASSASMKAAEGCHPGAGATTTPRGVARNAFSKWTNESPARSCSAPRTGLDCCAVKRVLKVESDATAGMVEPCPRSSVKGWAKVRLFTTARGQVVVTDHGLGDAGELQARGEVAGVTLRERRGGVHPGAAVEPEAGAAQHLVAPDHLGADLPGDPGRGERGQIDGHVGLVDHLVAAERGQLGQRALAVARARARDARSPPAGSRRAWSARHGVPSACRPPWSRRPP